MVTKVAEKINSPGSLNDFSGSQRCKQQNTLCSGSVLLVSGHCQRCATRFSAGTHLFSIYFYDLCNNLSNSMYCFNAVNTIVYCCSTLLSQAVEFLQLTVLSVAFKSILF